MDMYLQRLVKIALSLTCTAIVLVACARTGVPVTGKGTDPTRAGMQSETAINVSRFWGNRNGRNEVITVAYNDETHADKTILYTSTTRTVLPGASLLGWSYSLDHGKTWTYGGKLSPPAGWAVLWGDPAITTSWRDQHYVFISNLAAPQAKEKTDKELPFEFPPTGLTGPIREYLGGACIVRSVDGGITFKMHQCVSNGNHDFYDGASMAASADGHIYAAFENVTRGQIDIWHSPNEDGPFTLMPPPFPGMTMGTHPRIRVARAGGVVAGPTDGTLYVAAQRDGDGVIFINRYYHGAWGEPTPASYPAEIYPSIELSDRLLRTGPQFSFDIGAPSIRGNDAVRFLYTIRDRASKRYYISGSYCHSDPVNGCYPAPEWGTAAGNPSINGDQFNPNVRAFPGFGDNPPVWKVSYTSREDDPHGNTVSLKEGNLVVLPDRTRFLAPFTLIPGHVVCSDERGYWGDYDDLQFVGLAEGSFVPQFIRAYTDSSAGCTERWLWSSKQVHVSAVVFQ